MNKRFEWNGYNVDVSERETGTNITVNITFSINDSVEGQYSFADTYEFIYAYLTNPAIFEMVGDKPIHFYEFMRNTMTSDGMTNSDFKLCVKELAGKYTVIKHPDVDDKYDNNYKISEFMLALYNGELLAYAKNVMLGMYDTQGKPWTIDEVYYSGNVKRLILRLVEYSCYNSNEYSDALEVIRSCADDYCVENLESLVDQSLEDHIFEYDSIDKRGMISDIHVIWPVTNIIETTGAGKKKYFPTCDLGDRYGFDTIGESILYAMFGPKHYDSVLCIYNHMHDDV